jgi:hypothetical protein
MKLLISLLDQSSPMHSHEIRHAVPCQDLFQFPL